MFETVRRCTRNPRADSESVRKQEFVKVVIGQPGGSVHPWNRMQKPGCWPVKKCCYEGLHIESFVNLSRLICASQNRCQRVQDAVSSTNINRASKLPSRTNRTNSNKNRENLLWQWKQQKHKHRTFHIVSATIAISQDTFTGYCGQLHFVPKINHPCCELLWLYWFPLDKEQQCLWIANSNWKIFYLITWRGNKHRSAGVRATQCNPEKFKCQPL